MDLHGPLVDPAELAAELAAALAANPPVGDLRVVDVRWVLGGPGQGRIAYDGGHIPGAIFLDLDTDLVGADGPGRHPLPRPADFARLLANRGIGDETTVVAYDDVGGWVAARLWWMLDDLGHHRVAVLDGGFQAWMAAGFAVTTADPALPDESARPGGQARPEESARPGGQARLSLAPAWTKVIARDALRARLGEVVLLDARGGPRYRGETEPIDPVPGHIPTSVHAPTDGNLGPGIRFLDPAVLRARFHHLGAAEPGTTVVTSCGSGVSACHNALAMRLAGLPDPILYEGSYSDWSRAGYPVAVGPEPGDPPA